MFYSWYFITTLFCFQLIQCKTCDLDDDKCMTKVAHDLFPRIVAGMSTRGYSVQSSEPLLRKTIVGDLPTIQYVFKDTSFSGFQDCFVTNVSVCQGASSFEYYLQCPELIFYAEHYKLNGNVGPIYVKGEGSCTILCHDYIFMISGHFDKAIGDDSEQHWRVTDHKLDAEARGGVTFNFRNLFCGDKEKSDAVHKFFNENWKIVDKTLRGPAINSFIGLFIQNMNDYLGIIPADTVLTVE